MSNNTTVNRLWKLNSADWKRQQNLGYDTKIKLEETFGKCNEYFSTYQFSLWLITSVPYAAFTIPGISDDSDPIAVSFTPANEITHEERDQPLAMWHNLGIFSHTLLMLHAMLRMRIGCYISCVTILKKGQVFSLFSELTQYRQSIVIL